MSSVVDEDTARTINEGRETVGAMLSSAQTHLQKVFIVFVLGFVGSFYALRFWIWDFLEATAEAEMSEALAETTDVITRSPFEVILLQAKIGMFVGILMALPVLLYYARDAFRERGVESVVPVSRTYVTAIVLTALALFVGGVAYAYGVFFPFMFEFLAGNASSAGVKPSFGIKEFTEFMALLTLSFGLAAQLPLFMGVLTYTEIVPYELFRDKWRHTIVGFALFGALFSPPEPFTQIMWATPMAGLYGFSLALSKVVTNVRRAGASEATGDANVFKRKVMRFAGGLVVVFAGTTVALSQGWLSALENEILLALPDVVQPNPWLQPFVARNGVVAAGLLFTAVIGLLALTAYTIQVLRGPVYPREEAIRTGDPEEIDLDVLDVDGIRAAPPQVFAAMDEEDALEHARQAMYDDDREKAQAILDRFDAVQDRAGDADDAETADDADETESEGVLASTAAGMLDPFTEDETTEEDIGGYAYDLAFIFQSLTSRMFRIVAVFMIVMGGTFMWLYSGGIGYVLRTFLERVPDEVLYNVTVTGGDATPGGDVTPADAARYSITPRETDLADMSTQQLLEALDIVVAIHPAEVLIFEVKVSTLAAIVAVLPMVLYYAWPAAEERGLVRGDRRVFAVWGGTLLVGFAVGTVLGFFYVAPAIISYLVEDAINNQHGMFVVSYRIKSFFWLVILTTVGVGFLVNVVTTMALFHVGGIVSYRTMVERWRPLVVSIFVVAAFATPKGVLTMLVISFPIALTYLLGLGVLYVLTAGGRLFGGGGGGSEVAGTERDVATE